MKHCVASTVLGIKGQGFHSHVFGIALGDVLATYALTLLIFWVTHWNFSLITAVTFLVAYLCHWYFCIV
jgi:hypothetical protein